jgi:hypothetical protein
MSEWADVRDDLQSTAEEINKSRRNSLDWLLAVNRWNELVWRAYEIDEAASIAYYFRDAQITNADYEEEGELVDPSNPFEQKLLKVPDFDVDQILQLKEPHNAPTP